MDPVIKQRTQWLIQDFWQSGQKSYEETRHHVLLKYRDHFPCVSEYAWESALRDAVVQCVRELVSEK